MFSYYKFLAFSVKQFTRNKTNLRLYLTEPKRRAQSILALKPQQLLNTGIEVLILDFDGVLASHGALQVDTKVSAWLREAINYFGENRIFILSNKPLASREQYFQDHFAPIVFFQPSKKKPHPDGIQQILSLTKTPTSNALIIDDRLATGILAAELAQIKAIYIYKPTTKFQSSPIKESWFMLLRLIERLAVKIT